MWHRDLPPDTSQVMDVIAKALMIRAGGSVRLTAAELHAGVAADSEISLDDDGSLLFRVERN